MAELEGKTVAILVADGFEESELTQPKEALEKAGAKTKIVSPSGGKVRSWRHREWGSEFPVDEGLDAAKADAYDALLLPGGVMNPDRLRMNEKAVGFVRSFFEQGKPVAAICHGPWTLIDAGVVHGRRMTSWPSLKSDLKNAGAEWTDREVVVDRGLVTSRKPDDLPAFVGKMVEQFSGERHETRRAG
jgi:protease I